MTVTFTYATNDQKKTLINIIREVAENHFKFDYQFGVFTDNKVIVHISNKAYLEDIKYAEEQFLIDLSKPENGCMNKPFKHSIHNFISDVDNKLNFYSEIKEINNYES